MKNKHVFSFLAGMITVTIFGFAFQTHKSDVAKKENVTTWKKEINTSLSFDSLTPLVNYDYFEELVTEVKPFREKRLISLSEFKARSKQLNTVILDTRSKAMYDQKHIKGAIHLNFADFNQWDLDNIFQRYDGINTQILIYCNNNFYDSRDENNFFMDRSFVSKSVIPNLDEPRPFSALNDQVQSLALNIPTFINLYGYGYKNVYELHEFIDVNDTTVQFEGSLVGLRNQLEKL